MRKITFSILLVMMCFLGFSQTFAGGGTPIDTQNNNGNTDATCGTADELNLTVDVTGVGTLGTTNFLEQVDIDITHTWSGDVNVTLIAPDGTTTVDLTSGNGGSGDDYSGTQFNDGATTSITAGSAPFSGAYQPEEPLTTFDGVDADGTWTLNFCDSANGDTGTFNSWSLTFSPVPTCTQPTATYTAVDDCTNSGGFFVDVDVTDLGDATSVTVSDDQGSTPVTIMMASTVQLGPFTSGTSVEVTVGHDQDSVCDITSPAVTFSCPPANDLCADAISITPGGVFTDNPVTGQTNAAASDSGEMPLPGCASYDPADVTGNGGDVWYSVTVPSDGNLTIETDADPTGSGGDGGMAVYTGSCGSLSLFECSDDDGPGLYGQVIIEPADALADQVVYIRVWEFGGNAVINFQVSAFSASLSTDEFENQAAFTYYPNPVKNTLTLNAQNTIENVTMYNMLGQEVLRANPNSVDSDIDMSNLANGSYFVKVTIANVTETIRVIKQ